MLMRFSPCKAKTCKTETFHKFISRASSLCLSAKPDFQRVFTGIFVVWNLILCNLCHSNPCCDWHMRERACSFDLHNRKHNFSFPERLKWPVMKWAEQQFEKQRQLLILLMSRCIMLATSSNRMMTGLLKFRKWKILLMKIHQASQMQSEQWLAGWWQYLASDIAGIISPSRHWFFKQAQTKSALVKCCRTTTIAGSKNLKDGDTENSVWS